MKTGPKVVLISIAGITVALALILGGFCSYLATPAGSRFLLAEIQKAALKYHTTIEFQEGQFNPFSRIHFRNLKVTQNDGGNQIRILIPEVDVLYSLSLFSRTVDVEKLAVDQPDFFVRYVDQSDAAKPGSPAANSTSKNAGDSVAHRMATLPVKIMLKKASVAGLKMDVGYAAPGMKVATQVQGTSLQMAFSSVGSDLSTSGQFLLGERSRVAITLADGQKKTQLEFAHSASAQWTVALHYVHSKWQSEIEPSQFKLNYSMKNFTMEGVTAKPARFDLTSDLSLPKDQTSFRAVTEAKLNEIQLAHLDIQGSMGDKIDVGAQGKVWADPRLAQVFSSAAQLKQVGLIEVDLNSKNQWNEKSALQGDTQIAVSQKERKKPAISFDSIHADSHYTQDSGVFKLDLKTTAPRLMASFLKKPLAFDWDAKASWESAKNQLGVQSALQIQKEEILKLESTSILQGDSIQTDATLDAETGKFLEGFLNPKDLENYGKWLAQAKMGLHTQGNSIDAKTTLIVRQERHAGEGLYKVALEQPITLQNKVSLNQGKLNFELEGTAPAVALPQKARIEDTHFSTVIRSPNIQTARDVEIEAEVRQGKIRLAPEWVGKKQIPVSLDGLNLNLKVATHDKQSFELKAFDAEFNHSMLKMTAEASGSGKAKDFQTRGKFSVNFPKDFPQIAGNIIHGDIEFPWTVSIYRGRDINFLGSMTVSGFEWSMAPFGVHQLSGVVPVSEQLVWDGKQIKFAYLIAQNPFERVDYDRLQPMIHETGQVNIGSMDFEEKKYGPFLGFFSIQQNYIYGHKFDFNMISGRSSGELYFDAYPSNLQFGILSRLTGLNLQEILPRKYLVKDFKGDKNLSGRMGIVVNLNKGEINGRMDMTEIGREQLLTMINVMDPKYVNEQMNKARFALGIAYPEKVQMSFQRGYMDMGITLGGLFAQQFDLRGIPIASWVSDATSTFVKQAREAPLR